MHAAHQCFGTPLVLFWLGYLLVVKFFCNERHNLQMKDLLHSSDYAPFALVGSGVQRKVDRLTLGVQTVCHHVTQELSTRYQNAVKERMHRVDPDSQVGSSIAFLIDLKTSLRP